MEESYELSYKTMPIYIALAVNWEWVEICLVTTDFPEQPTGITPCHKPKM
jgi:hypothetical protein